MDIDKLLALKSLVLANETSTNDLRELAKTQDEGETSLGPVAVQGVTMHHSLGSSAIKLLTQDVLERKSQDPTQINNYSTWPVFSKSTRDTSKSPAHWTRIDRYEFALQRLNLAKWEHERIEENVAIRPANKLSLDDQRREESCNRAVSLIDKPSRPSDNHQGSSSSPPAPRKPSPIHAHPIMRKNTIIYLLA